MTTMFLGNLGWKIGLTWQVLDPHECFCVPAMVEWWLSGVPDVYHCINCIKREVDETRVGYCGGIGVN